jgi:hypothetical protein
MSSPGASGAPLQLGILGTAAWCREQIEAELKEKASRRKESHAIARARK